MATTARSHLGTRLPLALAAFTVMAAAAGAATFTVTKTTDDDGPCEPADCSLREAVIASNANPDADRIILAGGRYTLSIPGPDEENSMTGDLDVLYDLQLEGDPDLPTIIVGDGSDRVIDMISEDYPVITEVTVSNVTITGGVSHIYGGGIQARGLNLTIVNSTITGNRCAYDGGGVYASTSDVMIMSSTISDNSADRYGGGIQWVGTPWADGAPEMKLINSTVSGNSAYGGGGIVRTWRGRTFLINSTIANNTANYGSAIYARFGVGPTFANSLIGGGCDSNDVILTYSYGGNIQGPDGTCYFEHPTDRMSVSDLRLGPLGYNGGSTMTHALLPGSPAIDGGLAENCPETDQRGLTRPVDGDGDSVAGCDVGAWEAGPRQLVTEVPVLGPAGIAALALLTAGAAMILISRSLRS